jgi:hypothetical protein
MEKLFLGMALLWVSTVAARSFQTNHLRVENAPNWLTESRAESVAQKIQDYLEWDVRRVAVYYHSSSDDFDSEANFNFRANAYFSKRDGSIHLSPLITDKNFEPVFGHELVHAIFYQKYAGAIPKWLEEGLANKIGRSETVDYSWLSKQKLTDVTQLTHPNLDTEGARYHYAASTALIDMIASKCSLKDLLQLSVGKNLQTYLYTYCEISDLNGSFQKWVGEQTTLPTSKKSANLPWWKKGKQSQWWDRKKK